MGNISSLLQRFGILLVCLLLLTYVWVSYTETRETQDAEMVESVQVSLQAAVSRGMTALQLPPKDIHPANIINAARTSFPKGVALDRNFHMVIERSGREVQFEVTNEGDLIITSLKNFTRFHIENGRIVRNRQWVLPLPF